MIVVVCLSNLYVFILEAFIVNQYLSKLPVEYGLFFFTVLTQLIIRKVNRVKGLHVPKQGLERLQTPFIFNIMVQVPILFLLKSMCVMDPSQMAKHILMNSLLFMPMPDIRRVNLCLQNIFVQFWLVLKDGLYDGTYCWREPILGEIKVLQHPALQLYVVH
jgi:hypothetical protein